MAANPNLPDFPDIPPRRPKDDHAKLQLLEQGKFPWPLVAFVIGLIILAVIVLYIALPSRTRVPAGSMVPGQPTGEQIQFTDIRMTTGPAGGAVYVEALLHNTGNDEINGVEVEATFTGNDGQPLESQRAPVQVLMQNGGAEDLPRAPIKPHESRMVRIYFSHMPDGWNHQPPQLRVTTVTGSGI